jgi:hypothetical protein
VTFYEGSHVNGTAHFTVTAIPVSIENPHVNGSCTGANALQSQPQAAVALSHSPWLDSNGVPVTYPVVHNNGALGIACSVLFAALPAAGVLYLLF